jgi:hypothetical protein
MKHNDMQPTRRSEFILSSVLCQFTQKRLEFDNQVMHWIVEALR